MKFGYKILDKKEHIVVVRVDQELYEYLQSQMKSFGMKSLSEYFRFVISCLMFLTSIKNGL